MKTGLAWTGETPSLRGEALVAHKQNCGARRSQLLDADQWQAAVPFAGQAKQRVHHGGRNDRNWRFTAS
jgi:hypothetical protein